MEPRSDYLGVHQPNYERIARGERKGWSTPEEIEIELAQFQRALVIPGVPQAGRLLELGCGDGCLAVMLAQRLAFSVYGIDIVPLAIELAQHRAASAQVNVDLRVGDVCALPWPDEYFDVLLDGHCLHCIVLNDRQRFFFEARRVLRPRGVLVVMTMCGDPPAEMPGQFDLQTRNMVREGVAGRHFGTPESLLSEIQAANFTVLDSYVVPAPAEYDCDEFVAVAMRPYDSR